MLTALRVLLLACALSALSSAGDAATPDCSNPRSATASLLDWLQPGNYDPTLAARCMDLPPDQRKRGPQLAVQLKQVLDARGLYVPTGDISTEPDHQDDRGRHRLVPVDTYPQVYLEKVGDRWLYSRDTVNGIPGMYKSTFSQVSLTFQQVLPSVFFNRVGSLYYWQLLYMLLLGTVAWGAGRFLYYVLTRWILGGLARFRFNKFARLDLLKRVRGPVTMMATSVILLWGIPDLQLGVRTSAILLLAARVLLSLSAVAIAYRLVGVVEQIFAEKAALTAGKLDDQLVPLVARTAKVIVLLLGLIFVLQNQGVDVASLLAGLGLGGLAFALAAKDTVENLFGSVTLFVDRPFQIGDWIVIEGKAEGVVEEVGLRSTRIRTFAKSLVSVPNGKVASATINNMGRRPVRRITTTIGVLYSTPRATLEAYVDRLNQIIAEHDETWKETCEIHFNDFGGSALQIMIYFFVEVPDWHRELRVRHEIFMEFIRAAEELGITFAFPSTSLYVESLPDGFTAPGLVQASKVAGGFPKLDKTG